MKTDIIICDRENIKGEYTMFFRVMEKVKDGLINTIFFILDAGIKGIAGLIFLAFIVGSILIELWEYILVTAIIGTVAFFLIKYAVKNVYRKYSTGREDYFKELVDKLYNRVSTKYEDKFTLTDEDAALIRDNSYQIPTSDKLPLERQYYYYEKKLQELLAIEDKVMNLNVSFFLMDRVQEKFYNRMKGEKEGFPFDIFDNKYKITTEYQSYFLGVREFYKQRMNVVRSGVVGENRMDKELISFSRNNEFYYLKNAVLQYNGKSFETDFLIVSKHGIFSLEVKNIGANGNLTIRIAPDGQWLKILGNGDKVPMQDVSSQVNYHISMTEGLLQEYKRQKGKELPEVKPVIIIANNNVMLDNQANLPIYRVSQFIHEMRSLPVVFNEQEMKEIYNWFTQFEVEQKSYEVLDYNTKLIEVYETLLKVEDQKEVFRSLLNEFKEEVHKDNYLSGEFYKRRFSTQL